MLWRGDLWLIDRAGLVILLVPEVLVCVSSWPSDTFFEELLHPLVNVVYKSGPILYVRQLISMHYFLLKTTKQILT